MALADIALTDILLLVAFGLIYLVFLVYDLFRRGDNYGSFVYIISVLPANYLWYVMAKNEVWEFGLTGCMMVLASMWLLAVIRDIYIKDRATGYKDADDVALMLVIGIVINLILSAVLPAFNSLTFMETGADKMWYFFFPATQPSVITNSPTATIMLIYKIIVSVLTLSMIYPIVVDFRDMSVNIVGLLLLTLIFGLPFLFLAYIWAPGSDLIWVLLILFSVVFFTFLLLITRGTEKY